MDLGSQPDGGRPPEGLAQLANELRALRRISHPNVVTCFGACVGHAEGGQLMLVLELVLGTTLQQFVENEQSGAPRCVALLGICRALWYLHSLTPPIVHGDVKPANIMLEAVGSMPVPWNHRAKLVDFGLSRVLSTHNSKPLGGSLHWMAPELTCGMRRPSASPAADVFSFGRLMYFIAAGCTPLEDQSEWAICYLAKFCSPPLSWPRCEVTKQCRQIAEECMVSDSVMRLKMSAVEERLLQCHIFREICQQFEQTVIPSSSLATAVPLQPMPCRPSMTLASSGTDPPLEAELLRLNPCTQLILRLPTGGCHPCAILTLQNQRGHHVSFRMSATDPVDIIFCPFHSTLGAHEQQDVAIVLMGETSDVGILGIEVHADPIFITQEDFAVGSSPCEVRTWTLMVRVQQESESDDQEDESTDVFFSWLAQSSGQMIVSL